MQANTLSQKAKGIIASVAGVLLVVLPLVLDGSAVKWVAGIIGVCAALGVVITPNAPTKDQYQAVARDVLGTSLVSAVTTSTGQLNLVTADNTPTTVTITPNREQGPFVNTNPRGAADQSTGGNWSRDSGSIVTQVEQVHPTGTDTAPGAAFDPMPGVDTTARTDADDLP